MKNIFKFVVFASMLMPLSSCMFEQEDFFDESSAIRMENAKDDIQNILCEQSADGKYGWVLQYFVAGTDEADFEGFTLFAKFHQDGQVTLASNHRYLRNGNAGKFTQHSSVYQMLGEEGPILSFSSWNDILTVFSDPVNPASAPGSLEQDGQGMLGDYNLVVTSFSKDEILLRGERHAAISRLIPCDRPWEEYIAATEKMQNSFCNDVANALLLSNGVDSAYVLDLHTGCFTANDRVDDPVRSETFSCTYSPDGFHLEKTESWGSFSFQNFVYDAENIRFVCQEDEKVTIAPFFANANSFFIRSINSGTRWKFESGAETSSVEVFQNLSENFNKGTNMVLNSLSLTKSDNDSITLSFEWHTSKNRTPKNYKYKYSFEETESGFVMKSPRGINSDSKKVQEESGVKEIIEFMTGELIVSDDVPGMTRQHVKVARVEDANQYIHLAY